MISSGSGEVFLQVYESACLVIGRVFSSVCTTDESEMWWKMVKVVKTVMFKRKKGYGISHVATER